MSVNFKGSEREPSRTCAPTCGSKCTRECDAAAIIAEHYRQIREGLMDVRQVIRRHGDAASPAELDRQGAYLRKIQ